jgi:cellulose synthase/poly-beta-1,6-N-acetylglucosamine synthase-like glycosyltransferase
MEKMLESILNNYEINDELILVINKKDSAGFPVSFLNRFTHVIQNPIKGISISRNLGISASRHNFVAFIDDDTYLPIDWRKNLHHMHNYKTVAFVQSQSSSIKHETFHTHLHNNRYILFDTAGSMMRKDALKEVGGFDESFMRSEDMDIATRLYFAGWDLSFSELETKDLNPKTLLEKLRNAVSSSKFEARIIKSTQTRYEGNYFLLALKILLDTKNPLRLKRLKYIHTYFHLKYKSNENAYSLQSRKSACLIIAGDDNYQLLPQSRIVFSKDFLMIYSLVKRNASLKLKMNSIKINQRSAKYYIEVPKDEFLENPDLFNKI